MSDTSRRAFGRSSLLGIAGFALGGPERPALHSEQTPAGRAIATSTSTCSPIAGCRAISSSCSCSPPGWTPTRCDDDARVNLSECTFVFPPEQAGTDHRVRIFTRTAETPFAGHPTIGTAFALAHR